MAVLPAVVALLCLMLWWWLAEPRRPWVGRCASGNRDPARRFCPTKNNADPTCPSPAQWRDSCRPDAPNGRDTELDALYCSGSGLGTIPDAPYMVAGCSAR